MAKAGLLVLMQSVCWDAPAGRGWPPDPAVVPSTLAVSRPPGAAGPCCLGARCLPGPAPGEEEEGREEGEEGRRMLQWG